MFKYDLIDLKTVDKTLKNKQLAKKKVRIIHNNYRIKVLKQLARLIKLTINNSIASKGLIKKCATYWNIFFVKSESFLCICECILSIA